MKLTNVTHNQLVRHGLLWAMLAVAMRYIIVESFFQDTDAVKRWVTIGQIGQTMAIYYLLTYYIFPKYLYNYRIIASLSGLFLLHGGIYISNYVLFGYLQQFNESARIDRDWALFSRAGLFGFATNGPAALWSFFYSFPLAMPILAVRVVQDIINLRTENLKLELSVLKAQVNPHFLFNTLNSVYGRVFDTDEQAADLVLRLSELMRYNLYEADVPRISLEKELAYIQNYLDLERNRLLDEDVLIEYEQEGQDPAGYQIAPLLLIAFVENAFKHGVKGATEPAYVQVRAVVDKGELLFSVENSVPRGRSAYVTQADRKSGGVGLSNVRRRLDALYKGRYELSNTANATLYSVGLRVRLH